MIFVPIGNKTKLARNRNTSYKKWFPDVLQNRCSEKFCRFYRKTRVESLFNKFAGLIKKGTPI